MFFFDIDIISYFPIELGDGLAAPLVFSLLLTHNVVGILTEKSIDIQEYIVNSGSLYQNFYELEEMKETLSGDQVTRISNKTIMLCHVLFHIVRKIIFSCSLDCTQVYCWQPHDSL